MLGSYEITNKINNINQSPSAHGAFGKTDLESEEIQTENSLFGLEVKKQEFTAAENDTGNCNGLQRGQDATGSIRATLGQAQDNHRAKAANTLDAVKIKSEPNATDIESIWKTAMRETFPSSNHVGWGIKQKGIVNRAVKKYGFGNTISFADLVEWSVRNWPQILNGRLSWMTKAPDTPTMNWWISENVTRLFAEAYNSGELHKMANSTEQGELVRLKAGGLTEQEALARIGEHRAVQMMHKKIKDAEQKANRTLADAKRREERAERMENMGDTIEEAIAMGVPVSKPLTNKNSVWGNDQILPHPLSATMKKLEKENRDAERENLSATKVNQPTTQTKMLTWEEVQERNRRINAGGDVE